MAAALSVLGSSAKAGDGQDSLRTIRLDSVRLSAFRAGEKTPVAYTNLSREEISRVNTGVDIPFMLTVTPSVVATSDAGTGIGYTSLSIRGTDVTRINVTANGVPLNDGESHKLYWVNIPDFASSAGGIQIQRGVGTSTNGPGAFGASINMTTEPLSAQPFAEITGSYGSFNTHKQSIRLGTGLVGGRWAFGGRLSNIGSDGYIDRASARLTSYFAQAGYFGRSTNVRLISFGGREATYHAWNGLTQKQIDTYGRRHNTAGEIWKTDRFGQTQYHDTKKKNPIIEGYYPDQKDFYNQHHVHLIVDQRLGGGWNLNLTGHYTRGDGYYEEYKNSRTLTEYGLQSYVIQDADGNDVTVKKSSLIRRKHMWNNFGGAIVSADYRSQKLDAVLGAAWNRYTGDHYGRVAWLKNYVNDELSPTHEYYRNSTAKNDANVFARASWTIARGLSLYGDVQYRRITHRIKGQNDNYDWINGGMQRLDVDRAYGFFNPKAGAYYVISPSHTVYASVGVAHKEPTRNDFTDARFGSVPRAERLVDYETGYKFSDGSLSFGSNLYYMHYRDQLVPTGELNDIGEPLADNVPDSFRLGAELTLGVRFTGWFRWDVFGTFSRNRIIGYVETLPHIDEGGDAVYDETTWMQKQTHAAPRNTDIAFSPAVIAGNIFTFTVRGFYGALQTNYVGRQYLTNAGRSELTLPHYCTTNLRASYRFALPATKYIELGVAVNNIFNARYSSFGFGYSNLMEKTDGSTQIVSGSGYFPQATANAIGSVTLRF